VGNVIAESNEDNNVGGPATAVVQPQPPTPGIDLVVGSCTATVYQAAVTYAAVVCNTGTQSAGRFVVGAYYNQAQAPAAGQTGDAQKVVQGLTAGQVHPEVPVLGRDGLGQGLHPDLDGAGGSVRHGVDHQLGETGRMNQRYQISGPLPGHHAGQLRDAQHVALRIGPVDDGAEGLLRHPHLGLRDRRMGR